MLIGRGRFSVAARKKNPVLKFQRDSKLAMSHLDITTLTTLCRKPRFPPIATEQNLIAIMGSRWPPPRDDGYRQGNRSSEGYRPSYSSAPQFPPYQGGGDSRNGGDRYNFGGGDRRYPEPYRNDGRNSGRGSDRDFRPPQGDFTFRSDRPSGVQQSYESFRGPSSSQRNGNDNYRPSRRNQGHGSSGGYGRGGPRGPGLRNGRGGFMPRRKERAADRLFLHKKHDDDAEDLLGDTSLRATYRNPDDLSESDEAEMDISGESDVEDDNEPAAKRIRIDDDDSVPKWSNPDPYTALPPPDETQRKKKDVVQMIRKARVEAEEKKQSDNTEAAEFISFDFSDDEEDDGASARDSQQQDVRVLNAPTGPRSSLPMALPSGLPPRPPENLIVPPAQPAAAKSTPARPGPIIDLTASTNLGSRKRTADDKIKERPHQPLQKGKKMKADATVESAWKPTRDEDACPWAVIDHSAEPNMGVR